MFSNSRALKNIFKVFRSLFVRNKSRSLFVKNWHRSFFVELCLWYFVENSPFERFTYNYFIRL